MRNIILLLIVVINTTSAYSQGTINVTSGTTITSKNGVQLVISNMNLRNNGSIQQSGNDGTIKFIGTLNDTISGNGINNYGRLSLAKNTGAILSLNSDIFIDLEVLFGGGLLNLENNVLDLGNNGLLTNEADTSRAYTTGVGYLQVARNLNAPSLINSGNLGAIISSGSNLGSTIIRRGHKVQTDVYGSNSSIGRFYEIIPANNSFLNATLRFRYFDEELNGENESTLSQWKNANNAAWSSLGYDTKDAANNFIEKIGISDFGKITLSGATQPIITCPAAITVNTIGGSCNASVNFSGINAAMTTGIPNPTVVYKIGATTISSPYTFSVGTTIVTAVASNGIGADASCSFNVTVIDNEKPVITYCPAVPVQCYSATGSYTVPSLTAVDNCGIQSINYIVTGATSRSGNGNNASGSFNPGTSTINWTVTDVNGNSATCSTSVKIDKLDAVIPDVYAANITPAIGQPNTIYVGYGGASVTLSAQVSSSVSPNSYTYKWTIGSPSGTTAGTGTTINVSPTVTTVYYLSVKDVNNCKPVTQVTKQVNVLNIVCGAGKITVCVPQKNGSYLTSCVSSASSSINKLTAGWYLGQCNTVLIAALNSLQNISKELPVSSSSAFDIKVSPNPSATSFRLVVVSDNDKEINIRVVDISGRLISVIRKVRRNETVTIGNDFISGTYFVEVVQGINRKLVKLVKVK